MKKIITTLFIVLIISVAVVLSIKGNVIVPPAPVLATPTSYSNFVLLTWPNVASPLAQTKYNVFRGTASGQETLLAPNVDYVGPTITYLDTTVTIGVQYFYYTQSISILGVPSVNSNEVSVTPPNPAGHTYYFQALSSHDTNPCTLANPCTTPQHATAIAVAGDIVYFRAGNSIGSKYILATPWVIDPNNSIGVNGNSSNPITYAAYPPDVSGGNFPVFTRGISVPNNSFTTASPNTCSNGCPDDVYLLPANSQYFDQLYYKGNRRPRPKITFQNAVPDGKNIPTDLIMCGCGGPVNGGVCAATQAQANAYFGAAIYNTWQPNFNYPAYTTIQDNESPPFYQTTYNACTSGNSQPSWNGVIYNTTTDNTCNWTNTTPVTNAAFISSPCTQPNPWMAFNILEVPLTTTVSATSYNIQLGHIMEHSREIWTMSNNNVLSSVPTPGNTLISGYLNTTNASTSNGNSGSLNRHLVVLENRKEDTHQGDWWINYCPLTPNCTVPDTQWALHIYPATGENPNTDQIIYPQGDPASPQIFIGRSLLYTVFSNLQFQVDNYVLPPQGDGETQGDILQPGAVEFYNSCAIDFNNNVISHVQAWGLKFIGPYTSACTLATMNVIYNNIVWDIGAGGVKIGEVACLSAGSFPNCVPDTNNNTPAFFYFFNNGIAYHGQFQPSGEATGLYFGDVHNFWVLHNDVYGGYAGEMNIGHALSRVLKKATDCSGTNCNPYFQHDGDVEWNHLWGRCVGAECVYLMSDFGMAYSAWSWSSACPTIGVPTLFPYTYCLTFARNWIHDGPSDATDTAHHGGALRYNDQGTSSNFEFQNMLYRGGQDGFFHNVPDHGSSNPAGPFLPQYTLFQNNIIVWPGSNQYSNTRGTNLNQAVMPGNVFLGNQNAVSLISNIWLVADSFGTTVQNKSGTWVCYAQDGITVLPCNTFDTFDYNDYWYQSGAAPLLFMCITPTSCPLSTGHNNFNVPPFPWGYSGTFNAITNPPTEDPNGISEDPFFINPVYPFDNFNFTNIDVMFKINWLPWVYTNAGRLPGSAGIPTAVSQPWPLKVSCLGTDTTLCTGGSNYVQNYTPDPKWSISTTP